jgi:V-type H+-transporting ATPase subunit e
MANGYSIFVGLVVIVALCLAAWFFSPKGENQVYVVSNPSIMHPRY